MDHLEQYFLLVETRSLWDKVIELKRNEYLLTEGFTDTSVYFIETGSLKVFFLQEDKEHIVRFGYQGEFVTALENFIKN